MSEAYQQKEWELNSLIDNLNSIEYTYEEYKKEVEHFIDRLLEDTKEINTLRNENKRLNKSLEEQRHFYLDQLQQKENTIKEARELIKTGASYCENGCIDDLSINDCNKILEILDKENK